MTYWIYDTIWHCREYTKGRKLFTVYTVIMAIVHSCFGGLSALPLTQARKWSRSGFWSCLPQFGNVMQLHCGVWGGAEKKLVMRGIKFALPNPVGMVAEFHKRILQQPTQKCLQCLTMTIQCAFCSPRGLTSLYNGHRATGKFYAFDDNGLIVTSGEWKILWVSHPRMPC